MATTETKPGSGSPGAAERTDDRPQPAGRRASAADRWPPRSRDRKARRRRRPRSNEPDADARRRLPPDPSAREPTTGRAPAAPNKLMADLAKAMQTAAEGSRRDAGEVRRRGQDPHRRDPRRLGRRSRRPPPPGRRRHRRHPRLVEGRDRPDPRGDRARIAGRKSGLDGELEDHSASIERRIARVRPPSTPSRPRWPTSSSACSPRRTRPARDDGPEPARAARLRRRSPPSIAEPAVAPLRPAAERRCVVPTPPPSRRGRGRRRRSRRRPGRRGEAPSRRGRSRGTRAEAARPPSAAPAEFPPTTRHATADCAAAEAEAASFSRRRRSDETDHRRRRPGRHAIAGSSPDARRRRRHAQAGDRATTRVIVVGLVSVASIASFKRHLGRVAGVSRSASRPVRTVSSSSRSDHDPGIAPRRRHRRAARLRGPRHRRSPTAAQVAAHDPEPATDPPPIAEETPLGPSGRRHRPARRTSRCPSAPSCGRPASRPSRSTSRDQLEALLDERRDVGGGHPRRRDGRRRVARVLAAPARGRRGRSRP